MQIPPFHDYFGIEIVSSEAGALEVALEVAPHHLNSRGVAHGGVVTAVLDSALGGAVVSAIPKAWWCATTSLSTHFVAGVGPGRLTATGRVVRRGRTVAFAEGEARDEKGRVVATAHGTWHLWDHRPGDPGAPSAHTVRTADGSRLAVGKILAVGRNYAAHAAEMGAPVGGPPVVFLKPASALVGDGAVVELPRGAGSVHHEVELVAVIGTRGKAIPRERALDHVLGFAVGLDLTLRDMQSEAKAKGQPWTLSKGFDGSAPVSTVVARTDVGDGSGLAIELSVNGERRQQGNTSRMLHGVADLVSEVSRWLTLDPGDLLFTGTPEGVGPIVPGDRLEARIERVGTLRLTIADS